MLEDQSSVAYSLE